MSTTVLRIMICDCDQIGIDDPCGAEVAEETLGAMRKKATAQGWKSLNIVGVGAVDLCPVHYGQYKDDLTEPGSEE